MNKALACSGPLQRALKSTPLACGPSTSASVSAAFLDASMARKTPGAGFLRVIQGGGLRRKGGPAGPGGKVDTATAFARPVCEIEEVSRVGAQGVTSKSKLLALEMPRAALRATTEASWRNSSAFMRRWGRAAHRTAPPRRHRSRSGLRNALRPPDGRGSW